MLFCAWHSWEFWSYSLLEDLGLNCCCLWGVQGAAGPGKLAFFANFKYSSVLALLWGVMNVVSNEILFWMPLHLLLCFFPSSFQAVITTFFFSYFIFPGFCLARNDILQTNQSGVIWKLQSWPYQEWSFRWGMISRRRSSHGPLCCALVPELCVCHSPWLAGAELSCLCLFKKLIFLKGWKLLGVVWLPQLQEPKPVRLGKTEG